jgi:hypothetical protein
VKSPRRRSPQGAAALTTRPKPPDEAPTENAFVTLPVESATVRAENTTTDLVVKGLQTSAEDLQMLGEEFVKKFAQRVREAVKQAVPRGVLAAHDLLSKAAEKKYLLTGKILAVRMGLKSSTISGWGGTALTSLGLSLPVSERVSGEWRDTKRSSPPNNALPLTLLVTKRQLVSDSEAPKRPRIASEEFDEVC